MPPQKGWPDPCVSERPDHQHLPQRRRALLTGGQACFVCVSSDNDRFPKSHTEASPSKPMLPTFSEAKATIRPKKIEGTQASNARGVGYSTAANLVAALTAVETPREQHDRLDARRPTATMNQPTH